ncbi:Aste57867_12714 [Aphanomyces stellatus]|uniref:Aste57867_12714 protein n=1 Tax=Aphanomyces stellatus TaxID=120398 RepID=A0A485KWC8_9STRA|nr:hypothetical protein As57867_012666 [Aphanomyces stellatus]VFT89564.1 Aste57867_12714 [Aphanomyces stellatus]
MNSAYIEPPLVPRYQIQVLANGDVEVIVPAHRNPCGIAIMTACAVGFLVGPVAMASMDKSGVGVVFVCIGILVSSTIVGLILTSLVGVERFMIPPTPFPRHWQVLCVQGIKTYGLATMGPLHITVSSRTLRDDDDVNRTRWQRRIGFVYGGATVSLTTFLLDDELEAFLYAISAYLPDHVKPRECVEHMTHLAVGGAIPVAVQVHDSTQMPN